VIRRERFLVIGDPIAQSIGVIGRNHGYLWKKDMEIILEYARNMISLQLDIICIWINIVINIVTPRWKHKRFQLCYAETFQCLNYVSTIRA